MISGAQLEIAIVVSALALGVLGDVLLRTFPWGANVALWMVLFVAVVAVLSRSRREVWAGGGHFLLLPVILSSCAFLWHDSLALRALNVLALGVALSLAMLRAQSGHLRTSSLMQYALGSVLAGLNVVLGMPVLLFGNSAWRETLKGAGSRRLAAVLRGLAFSILPFLVFGGLFIAADAVFQHFAQRLLHFEFTDPVIVILLAFAVGGYLRGLLLGKELTTVAQKRPPSLSLGTIEMGIMLGLLDLLFLAFVIVQVQYFFGGSAWVQSTTGLTYAEYARRGFFELVAVAALLLPFLLLVHWLLPREDAKAQRLFRGLAGAQLILLTVIMVSAFQRLRLYEAQYGLSEQRLYPTAFLGWLAVVFVWFALTVLRGHRDRFAFGAMVAGFLLIAVLHALNPDALIARTNLRRAKAGSPFDAGYAASLSADAVPDLVAGLPFLNSRDRCRVAVRLVKRWGPAEHHDWRSWSYSRSRAWQAVRENAPAWQGLTCTDSDH